MSLDHPLEVDDNLKAAMQFGAAPLGVDTFERAMKSRVRNAKEIGVEAIKHRSTRHEAGDFAGAAEAHKQAYDRDTEDPGRPRM